MFETTNLWAAAREDRDLSRAAAERSFMLQAVDAASESHGAAVVLGQLFCRLTSVRKRSRLADSDAQAYQRTMGAAG